MASSGEIEKLERRWAENQLGLTFAPLAEAYRKAGDPERALLLLATGMAQHPNYIPAHIVKGRCYLDSQSDGEAELSFLRVTELDPENVIALKSLAEISERAGRLPEAMRRLEMLLDIDRSNEEARGQLDRVRELQESVTSAPAFAPEPVAELPAIEEPVFEPPVMEPVAEAPAPVETPIPAVEAVEAVETIEAAEAVQADTYTETPAPGFMGEYQLRNDAETLLPSDERFEGVVRAEDTELEVHEEEEKESFVLSVGDFSSSMAYEPPPPPPEEVPEPVAEPAMAESEEPVPEEAAPVVLEVPVSIVDVHPPPPVPDSSESYAVAESEETVAAEQDDTDAPAPEGEPELVVTETMAEIFLRQGHRELALAVYTQLSLREPWNDRISAAAAALQQELAPPAPPPPPPPPPEPQFAAAETGGRSVHTLLGALLTASRPAVATAIHPPAFESPRPPAGEPTRPAQDALSLSAVFGDEAGPSGPAAPPVDSVAEPSFDEFFAPGSSAESELPKPPGTEPAGATSQAPEDLEQFNAWLRGLKR